MNPIGPGDWVECVDVAPMQNWLDYGGGLYLDLLSGLHLGAAYCVERVILKPWGPELQLHGVRSPTAERGWDASRFRPIYTPKESLLRDLMQPIDTKVDA